MLTLFLSAVLYICKDGIRKGKDENDLKLARELKTVKSIFHKTEKKPDQLLSGDEKMLTVNKKKHRGLMRTSQFSPKRLFMILQENITSRQYRTAAFD